MEHRTFGSRDAPVIGMGTWRIKDRHAAQQALRRGLQLGLDHIDTAELYTGAETAIAGVIGGKDPVLVSKVLPQNASRVGTRVALEATLNRLGRNRIDAYLIHWPGPYPIEDTMHAMADLIDEGLIGGAGVSNFDVEHMEAAQEALGRPLVCNQVLYHPEARQVEVDVLPWCKQHGVAVVGYSPFGSGNLGRDTWARLGEIGAPHGKTGHQVVLDVLSRDAFLIPKSENVDHVVENATAITERLPQEAVDAFDEAFPVPEEAIGVPTL